MDNLIGLRIDVDTVEGYKKGVITLLDLLRRFNIKASFFIVTGYDTPFRMIPRLFYERGFLRRVFRLKRTLDYKLLSLRSSTFQKVIESIKDDGHELGLHGYQHFNWQLHLREWSVKRIDNEISQAVTNFKLHTGSYPCSFAVPGWITKKEVFLAEKGFHFDYCSDTRGIFPFYPYIDSLKIKIPQIPVTLPTLDELIALGKPNGLLDLDVGRGDVYCAHAEFEGLRYKGKFEAFLKKSIDKGYQFVPLAEIRKYLVHIPFSTIVYKTLPGRTNIIAFQMSQQTAKRE